MMLHERSILCYVSSQSALYADVIHVGNLEFVLRYMHAMSYCILLWARGRQPIFIYRVAVQYVRVRHQYARDVVFFSNNRALYRGIVLQYRVVYQ